MRKFQDFLTNPTSFVLKKTIKILNNENDNYYRLSKAIDGKEYFYSPSNDDINFLSFFISLIAAYLSWSCNTAKGYSFIEKLFFSFFAFIFGGIYLLYYFLVRYDECKLK
jgi:hypothetical protein